jgi:predicted dehydrogenase
MQKNLNSIKIGILGQSNLSAHVLSKFEKAGSLCITGIHGTRNPGGYYHLDSCEELIDMSDAFLISDLAWSDFASISNLVKNSKHVYLENACLLTIGEIKRLGSLATEAGVIVQLGLKHRYHKVYRILKSYELKPRIIECSRFMKFTENATSISVISDLMMHDIDVVLTIAGSGVKAISATGVGQIYDDPDVVNARIEFYNGCIANLSASKISIKNVHKTQFFQNNSHYTVNFLDQSFKILKNGIETDESKDVMEDVVNDSLLLKENADSAEIFAKEIETFYHCIVENNEPDATIDDFLNTKLVADLICDQLERNYKSK